MTKKLQLSLAGTVAAMLFSVAAYATTYLTYPWYNNPYSYTNVYGCTWTYTGSYGGSWGSQFNYVSTGSCQFSTMQVNHPAGANYVNIVLN